MWVFYDKEHVGFKCSIIVAPLGTIGAWQHPCGHSIRIVQGGIDRSRRSFD